MMSVAEYFSSDSSTDRMVGYEPTDGGSNPSPSTLGCLTKGSNYPAGKDSGGSNPSPHPLYSRSVVLSLEAVLIGGEASLTACLS